MKEKSMQDFLMEHLDWLSVTNYQVSFDELLIDLDKQGIAFDEKRNFDNRYCVIHKDSYSKFIDYMVGCASARITRFDLAFDIAKDYMEIVNEYINEWCPHSCVGSKDRFQTIYFNSRQSDMFCRLYDKQLEAGLDNPLTRLEYEVKGVIALQFSMRLVFVGVDDALSYLIEYIEKFNISKNLLLIRFQNLGKIKPVEFSIIDKAITDNKFRRFIRQYRKSIIDYCMHYGLSGIDFLKICEGEINIEKLFQEGL